MKIKDNAVILFQGDSITDGNRGRDSDPNHILGHGYQFIISGKIAADNLDKIITCINRGVSGNRVSDLCDRWDEDCIKLNPDILSILVGVNDAHFTWEDKRNFDFEAFKESYKSILNEARKNNPNIKIILMEPFYENIRNDDYSFFMDKTVRELAQIVKEIAKEYEAIFVPLQDIFDKYKEKADVSRLIWDGVHPTYIGHELIARRWIDVCEIK